MSRQILRESVDRFIKNYNILPQELQNKLNTHLVDRSKGNLSMSRLIDEVESIFSTSEPESLIEMESELEEIDVLLEILIILSRIAYLECENINKKLA